MRFGLFVPQGWRLDLVGIDPAKRGGDARLHAARGGRAVGVGVGLRPLPHRSPADGRSDSRGVDVDGRTRCIDVAYPTRPDVYRHELPKPGVPRQVAATTDLITGGRVEMGIGGGWYEQEWRAYGYGFPSAGERLGRLDEGIQIMQQAWSTGSATLDGKYYQVDGALCRPLPLQEGGIPIWLPVAARRSHSRSRPSTRSTRTSTAPRPASRTSPRS